MSKWHDLDLQAKVITILEGYRYQSPYTGCAFVNGYQLAIEFARRYPEETRQIGMPVGGAGTGQRNSLAQYIALQLSTRIQSGAITDIEMGYLSTRHLNDLSYDGDDGTIHASSRQPYDIGIFRLVS
jgi:hypothetical protein